jgi:hypothetical protein
VHVGITMIVSVVSCRSNFRQYIIRFVNAAEAVTGYFSSLELITRNHHWKLKTKGDEVQMGKRRLDSKTGTGR